MIKLAFKGINKKYTKNNTNQKTSCRKCTNHLNAWSSL